MGVVGGGAALWVWGVSLRRAQNEPFDPFGVVQGGRCSGWWLHRFDFSTVAERSGDIFGGALWLVWTIVEIVR